MSRQLIVAVTVVVLVCDVALNDVRLRPRQVITLSVDEERPVGTLVCDDLISEAALASIYPLDVLSSLQFVLLGNARLFQIDRHTGSIRTAVVIDRELMCRQLEICVVRLDVAIQPIK